MSTLPLLRLLQIADSSFPVGGFAFSHGLEWLAHQQRPDETELARVVDAYVMQAGGGQWLPAARAAWAATTPAARSDVDDRLDASMAVEVEREAGRAMGERLLVAATAAFGGGASIEHLRGVREARAPGQFAAAFGIVAADQAVPVDSMLAALGSSMAASIVQAAVRLGLIGQTAAVRLSAGATAAIDTAVSHALDGPPRRYFGSFTPGLDVAGLRHPSLPFRMFAS